MRNNQKGFFQIGLLIFVPILILALAGILNISLAAQNSLARQSQLDICAKKNLLALKETAQYIQATNNKLLILQKIIYASRGLAVLSAGTSVAGERSALITAKLIATSQYTKLIETDALLLMNVNCKRTSFSDSTAMCKQNPTTITKEYKRSATLFPDVPGILIKQSKAWNIECSFFHKKEKTKISLREQEGSWQEKYEI